MPGQSQTEFLSRVRDARGDRGEPVALPLDLEVARVIASDQDVVGVFAARVEESGMHAHRVADEPAMLERVTEIVAALGARSTIVPAADLPAREKIIARLEEKGIHLCGTDAPDAAFDRSSLVADIGIDVRSLVVNRQLALDDLLDGDLHGRLACGVHHGAGALHELNPAFLDHGRQLESAAQPGHQLFVLQGLYHGRSSTSTWGLGRCSWRRMMRTISSTARSRISFVTKYG